MPVLGTQVIDLSTLLRVVLRYTSVRALFRGNILEATHVTKDHLKLLVTSLSGHLKLLVTSLSDHLKLVF